MAASTTTLETPPLSQLEERIERAVALVGQLRSDKEELRQEKETALADGATAKAALEEAQASLEAAEKLKSEHGIDCEVVDVRSLVPLDTQTILGSVARTHRLFTVEENPRLCGWGAEIVSIVADEAFYDLDGPPVRITTPHIPLPAADILEDLALPSVDRIAERVRRSLES